MLILELAKDSFIGPEMLYVLQLVLGRPIFVISLKSFSATTP